MHGVGDDRVKVIEADGYVKLRASYEKLTPEEARYVASKLVRLAKRVEKRLNATAPDDGERG